MRKKPLVMLVLLASMWIASISSVEGESGLRIALFGYDPLIRTFTPFKMYLEIVNNDSIRHSFTIWVFFGGYELSGSGFVDGNGYQNVYLTLLPAEYGNQTIEVRLYQDSPTTGLGWVDIARASVTVEKGYPLTQIDNLNSEVDSLKTDLAGLSDLASKLTYAVILLSAIVMVLAGVSVWLATGKRQIRETMPKPDTPTHTQ